MGDDDTHMSIPADLMKNIEWMRAHLTKRREQGNYNATDRFVIIAIVNSHEVGWRHRIGTETFDHIWRGTPPHTTHLVLMMQLYINIATVYSAIVFSFKASEKTKAIHLKNDIIFILFA